MEAAFVARNL